MSQYDANRLRGLREGPQAMADACRNRRHAFYDSIKDKTECVSKGAARRTQQKYAERMLTIKEGPRPEGAYVRHLCERDSTSESPCCNPNHLTWGTPSENTADGIDRGNHNWQTDPNHPVNLDVQCPHCAVVGKKMIMMRWHFDRCPKKVTI